MLQYTAATGKHFLEHLLDTALELIKKRDVSCLKDFLSIPSLKPLHPIIFLLGWDVARETEDPTLAQNLVKLLHGSINIDGVDTNRLSIACAQAVRPLRRTYRKLSYHIGIIERHCLPPCVFTHTTIGRILRVVKNLRLKIGIWVSQVYQAKVTDHCKNHLRPGCTRSGQ